MRGIVVVLYLSGYLNIVLTKRSNMINSDMTSFENSRHFLSSNELPKLKKYFPGHSLIKPTKTSLNSAMNYPKDNKNLVYGNLENLGITYDKTPESLWYSGFRKGNDPLERVLKLIKAIRQQKENHNTKPSAIVILSSKRGTESKTSKQNASLLNKQREQEIRYENLLNNRGQMVFDNSSEKGTKLYKNVKEEKAFSKNKVPEIQIHLPLSKKTKFIQDFLNSQITMSEEENNANEVLDQYSSEENISNESWHPDHRRMRGKKKKDRDSKYISDSNSKSFESASSDYEKNPGNPYTIHRDKYKKNWLWNHVLDGDHMNINPLAPQFANTGPSGAELFFGRKWWYYNQDDYKPMA